MRVVGGCRLLHRRLSLAAQLRQERLDLFRGVVEMGSDSEEAGTVGEDDPTSQKLMLNTSEISVWPRDRNDARAFALTKGALDHPPELTHAVDERASEVRNALVVRGSGAVDQQAQAFEESSTRAAMRKAALETTGVLRERFVETNRA